MLQHLLAWHRERYPMMQAQDIVKLIFQAYRGCGHLLGPEDAVTRRIEDECARLTPCADEPLTEPLGDRYVRLNLRRAMSEGIRPLWIARIMKLSCTEEPYGNVRDVIGVIQGMQDYNDPAMHDALRPLLDNESWLPSHSAEYHAHYAPAYRVIERKYAYLLPVLCAAGKIEKNHVLIGIDGRCASGKSTLAGRLAAILGGIVVSMDDFFTPHAEKTPERLALPGGNADVLRFRDEVLTPWLKNGTTSYRPYSCHEDRLLEPVTVPPTPYMIVEGSYCFHPDAGRPYDVSVFLSVPFEEQVRRIGQRDGDWLLQRFIHEWIPLEEAYFSAFGLPDDKCITLRQPDQC